MTTLDATALPIGVPPEAPTCPTAVPSAPERAAAPCPAAAALLASWARERCPNLRGGWRCVAEHARGRERCRLMLDPPKRCPWAEQGPALSAPEPIFRAYLHLAGGAWWSRTRREPTPQAPPVEALTATVPVEAEKPKRDDLSPNPHAAVEGACLAAGRGVERLCSGCGAVPLAPFKKLCPVCKRAAARASRRRRQARYRRNL
ncbi:MAG: hypothetical protein FJ290_14795 [Planctomycetes bacterium]|nr:hypothetical protein [Planctomycetota bacterium]